MEKAHASERERKRQSKRGGENEEAREGRDEGGKIQRERESTHACASERETEHEILGNTHAQTRKHENVQTNRQTDRRIPSWSRTHSLGVHTHTCTTVRTAAQRTHTHTRVHIHIHIHNDTATHNHTFAEPNAFPRYSFRLHYHLCHVQHLFCSCVGLHTGIDEQERSLAAQHVQLLAWVTYNNSNNTVCLQTHMHVDKIIPSSQTHACPTSRTHTHASGCTKALCGRLSAVGALLATLEGTSFLPSPRSFAGPCPVIQ